MEFRILGPLEVRDGDREIPLGGPRRRALLAVLLTHANQVVPIDRLIDELWGDEPPETAANVVQGHVSQLRKELGERVIARRGTGYAAVLEAGQLDLHRFERLLAEGSRALESGYVAEAADRLRDALALWRGPALADVAEEPFARREAARLEELRLVALERRIEAELALGHHADLVPELEALVAGRPLRERLRAQLMLALYRSGRQAEALDAYRAARRALVDQLGIEPSPLLQELERAILRQDPALQAPAAFESSAPAARLGGAGRPAAERAILVLPHSESSLDLLVSVAEPLARRPPRELVLARLVTEERGLADEIRRLSERRTALASRGVSARVAAYTSDAPGEDAVLLAAELDADLVLVATPPGLLDDGVPDGDLSSILATAPCDVGVLVGDGAGAIGSGRPVLVPFGGAEHDWTAVEIAAWVALSLGATLRLLGTSADRFRGRRDASRLLARASLVVQAAVGVVAEPLLVRAGAEGVLGAAEDASAIVVGLSERWRVEGLGPSRLAVARAAPVPVLLVRRGLRPGGLAPRETLTRFTWSLEPGG